MRSSPYNAAHPEAIESFKSLSVAKDLYNQQATMALSRTFGEGNDVYFRPGGLLSSGGITAANVVHEGLHILTRMGDTRLAQKLGLPEGSDSESINPVLKDHNCI